MRGWLLLLFLLASNLVVAGEEPTIGHMRLAIWPEYDDPGILVIYDGRFAETTQFPLTTRFLLPKGAVINDACSLSPEGNHFCQLYTLIPGKAWDLVELWLPFPNFYLSFHLPMAAPNGDLRQITFPVRGNHGVKNLVVDVQQPLRSSGFTLEPVGGEQVEVKGFQHFRHTFDNVKNGEERIFRIQYSKQDLRPSMDVKFSAMSGPKVTGSPYATQSRIKEWIQLLFATGLLAVGGLVGYRLFRRKRGGS